LHGDFVAFAAYIALFANTSGMHLASAFTVAILATIVWGFHGEGGLASDEAEKRIPDDAHHHLDRVCAGTAKHPHIHLGGSTRNYDIPVRRGFEFFGATITSNQVLVILAAFFTGLCPALSPIEDEDWEIDACTL